MNCDAVAAAGVLRSIDGIETALEDMIWVQGRHHQNLVALREGARKLLERLEQALRE